jgi:hypothetical protein
VNGKKFMSITFHWTDEDWNVRSQTLDLVPVEANATGQLTEKVLTLRLDGTLVTEDSGESKSMNKGTGAALQL